MNILFFMVVRNAKDKQSLFSRVLESASVVSKNFYIVDHGSNDGTPEIIEELAKKFNIKLILTKEDFTGTMDDIKAKHFKIIKETTDNNYIFAIDSDEVISKELAQEIQNLDFKNKVYLIPRDTFFLQKPIREKEYLPLFFEINSVEINTFSAIHNLYKIHSQDITKLKGTLLHYSYEDIDDLTKKMILYSRIEAKQLVKNNVKYGFFYILFRIFYEGFGNFIYQLIVFKNYRHLEGFFYTFSNIPRVVIKYLFYIDFSRK